MCLKFVLIFAMFNYFFFAIFAHFFSNEEVIHNQFIIPIHTEWPKQLSFSDFECNRDKNILDLFAGCTLQTVAGLLAHLHSSKQIVVTNLFRTMM